MDALEFYSKGIEPFFYFNAVMGCGYDSPQERFAQFAKANMREKSIHPEDLFIDLGGGPGTSLGPFLRNFNFKKSLVIDGSQAMLNFFKSMVKPGLGIEAKFCNLVSDTVPAETDSAYLVSACLLMAYLSNIAHIFSETARILRPGGYFIADLVLFKQYETKHPHFFIKETLKEGYEEIGIEMYYYSEEYLVELQEKYNLRLVRRADNRWGLERKSPIKLLASYLLFQKAA